MKAALAPGYEDARGLGTRAGRPGACRKHKGFNTEGRRRAR